MDDAILLFLLLIWGVPAIFGIILGLKDEKDKEKNKEKNKVYVDYAVSVFEDGCKMAEKMEENVHLYSKNNGFRVCISIDRDNIHFANYFLEKKASEGWILTPDYLEKSCNASYAGGWDFFKNIVFEELHRKHPNWHFSKDNSFVIF